MKRIFDILTALFVLIITFPLLLFIGLGVKLSDGGPVFFKQKRVGLHGKTFYIYKFRSMRINNSASEGTFEPGQNNRITPFGRLLRNTKMDEIPQLLNVLKSEMSVVGPRPEVEKWILKYPERWKQIHSVKPGITDLASIAFRNEEAILSASENPEKTYEKVILPRKLDLYDEYIRNQSFLYDLKLIFLTFLRLFNNNL